MDDIVLRAMAKWPNVPAVYGWLSLDRRGRWLIKGEPIGNGAAREFISRNYASDERGRWFFQNGPQRVYVALEYTPWVYALDGTGQLWTHTGLLSGPIKTAYVDEAFNLILGTETGPGVVDDRDLATLVDALTDATGRVLDDDAVEVALGQLAEGAPDTALYLSWGSTRSPVQRLDSHQVAALFKFVPQPREDG